MASVPIRGRRLHVAIASLCVLLASCRGGLLGPQYEYEEQLRLSVDGTARLDLNASIPALVALRGVDLNPHPDAEIDREDVGALFEGPGVEVSSVRLSRRRGRRFVHVRLEVDDIRRLSRLAPFSWSTYTFTRHEDRIEYRQAVGAPAERDVEQAGWDGNEIVAFRMHLPSVITFHNAPSRRVERGNILEWEQPLNDRRAGVPLVIQVQMEPDSILYSTLLLFASAIALAAVAFAAVIWRLTRRGRADGLEPVNGTTERP